MHQTLSYRISLSLSLLECHWVGSTVLGVIQTDTKLVIEKEHDEFHTTGSFTKIQISLCQNEQIVGIISYKIM